MGVRLCTSSSFLESSRSKSVSWVIMGVPSSQQAHGLLVCLGANQAIHQSVQEESVIKAYAGDPMKKDNNVLAILHASILFQEVRMHEQIFDGLSADVPSFTQGLNGFGIRPKVHVHGSEQKMALQVEGFAFDHPLQNSDRPRDVLMSDVV